MIRIELRQRSPRWRAAGIGALLLVAAAAFAGAFYTLGRSGIALPDWMPQVTSPADEAGDVSPVATDVHATPAQPEPVVEHAPVIEVRPDANDAPGQAADLLIAAPSIFVIEQLVIDENGAFTIEGRTTDDLTDSLGPLRQLARDVRATTWTSGSGPSQARITGIVNGAATSVVPSTRQQAATRLAEAEALATRHGLQQVRISAIRADVSPAGGLRYRADLSAVGEASTTRSALRAILDHKVGIVHAALYPVGDEPAQDPPRHRVTLLLDTAVRDEGNP